MYKERFKSILKKSRNKIIALAIVSLGFVSYGFVESYFELSKNLEIVTSVMRELNTYYVDEIKPGDLMKKGIDGMLESLDPYTEYYPESDIEDYKVMITGQYGGIGAMVRQKGDYIVISEPYQGFPAQKADIRAGDIILEINGASTKGKTTSDISKLLKGQPNTHVKVVLQREGEKTNIEKDLVREDIKIKNVPYFGMISDSVGYIKLTGFTDNAGQEVKDAFVELKEKKKAKAIVLDLRGNGGGLLREAVEIVNLFVDKGATIVSQKGKVKETNRIHIAEKSPIDTKIPIAVIVDRGSASASEIVTGAIQDLDRGVVVGQRSFGKGLVQQTYPLAYNTQMKVTIAKYYTPSGRCIQALDYFHRNPDGSVDKVADSLMHEFKTKGGRTVFDGSGIFPDITLESHKYSPITNGLIVKELVFDYATKYRLSHPAITDATKFKLSEADYEEFSNYVLNKESFDYETSSEKILLDFKTTAEKEKYFDEVKNEFELLRKKVAHDKKEDLQKFKSEIKEILEAEISARYYYQRGRLETSFDNDTELLKSITVLQNNNLYASILKGEGEYAVIGKPKPKDTKEAKQDETIKKNKKGNRN